MSIIRVVYYELRRELRKRSLIALLILALMPIPAALLIRSLISEKILEVIRTHGPALGLEPSKLWAYVLGAAEPPPAISIVSLLGAASLVGFAWLAAILYGGDLIASDMRDKMIHYILVRPVRRSEYIAGKILTVVAFMEALFLVAGLMVYAASWIMFGPQSGLHEAIVVSLAVGVGLLPLLLTSSAIGAATRNPLLGILLGFAAYFVSAFIAAIIAIAFIGGLSIENIARLTPIIYAATAANPYTSYEMLVKALYSIMEGEVGIAYWVATPFGFRREYIPVWPLAGYAIASLAISTVVLAILNWLLVARRDL